MSRDSFCWKLDVLVTALQPLRALVSLPPGRGCSGEAAAPAPAPPPPTAQRLWGPALGAGSAQGERKAHTTKTAPLFIHHTAGPRSRHEAPWQGAWGTASPLTISTTLHGRRATQSGYQVKSAKAFRPRRSCLQKPTVCDELTHAKGWGPGCHHGAVGYGRLNITNRHTNRQEAMCPRDRRAAPGPQPGEFTT